MESVIYTATLELLSPLHIGTGTTLLEGVDWIQDGPWVYMADQNRLLETVLDRALAGGQDQVEVIEAITGMTLADLRQAGWLTRDDFDEDSPLFRYRLRGEPAMNQIAEAIKDVYGQPYMPGSSLKGALRTVLAVGGASVLKTDLSRPGRSRSWAAQPIEREIFGRDPNRDLLRALQVGDSTPVSGNALELVRVNVFPTAQQTRYGRSQGLDVDVEALRRGTALTATIKVDGTLFGDDTAFGRFVEKELSFGKKRNWLTRLPRWAQTVAGRRIANEIEFLESKTGGEAAAGFYRRLAGIWDALGENEFLVQVGWGTGWSSKTFGRMLQRDPEAFERLVRDYRLSPQDRGRRAGQPFPKSRKLVRRGERPAEPLGWIKVKLNARA
jgi:CRISPR-associated protein Csm5